MNKIIDTHAHVTNRAYKEELENVIQEMVIKNTYAYNIGTTLEDSVEIIELSKKHKNLIPVIGVHPCDVQGWDESFVSTIEGLVDDSIAAIGEIGLDYYHEPYDKEEQKRAFIDQIEIAKKFNLPIVVHTRESLEDCFEIVKNYPEVKFLFHSWSGDKEMTEKYLSVSDNFYFSYNGILTFKNAPLQQEVINYIPSDRLLFETDCPWLSPVPHRGQLNFPWRTKDVIKFAAELLGMTFEELNDRSNANAKAFYNVYPE